MRGTWFYDQTCEPVEEEICDRIELEHIHKFKDHILNKINYKVNNNENNDPSSAGVNIELLNNEGGLSNEQQTTVSNSNKSQSKPVNDRMCIICNY